MRQLRALARPGAGVEIDGGIGPDTIADAVRAGANRLTAGSAIYAAPSPGDAYRDLVERVRAAATARRDMTLVAAERARLERALELAERGARTAAPNPAVGCVLVAAAARWARGGTSGPAPRTRRRWPSARRAPRRGAPRPT